ncbi:MAG: hypothetical protein ACT4PP_06605, partial [Sporichthyaceae bacterium]
PCAPRRPRRAVRAAPSAPRRPRRAVRAAPGNRAVPRPTVNAAFCYLHDHNRPYFLVVGVAISREPRTARRGRLPDQHQCGQRLREGGVEVAQGWNPAIGRAQHV